MGQVKQYSREYKEEAIKLAEEIYFLFPLYSVHTGSYFPCLQI